MATTKKVVEIEIDVDSGQVKQLDKELDKVEQSTKDIKKGAKGMSGAFKMVGTAIKAAGIGLLIAVVAKVGEVFSKNQKFIDGFAIAMDTASIVIKDIGEALVRVYDTVSSSIENFDALGKVLSGITTLVLTPLKLEWYAIQAGIVSAQLAWQQSFFGDKDPGRIKELKAELNDIGESLKGVAVAAGDATMDIYNNFSEAIDEAGAIATTTMEELKTVSISAAIEQAKYITEVGKAAELAEVQQQGLIEKYDREAELLRQVRDDFNRSFEERIAANEELSQVLTKQTDEEKELIEIRKNALQAQYDAGLVAQQEYLISYETLKNEEAEIDARIEGFRSEQLINRQSLEKEQADLAQDLLDKKVAAEKEANDKIKADALALAEAKQKSQHQTAEMGAQLLTEFASFTDAESKRGFQIQKAAALSEAVVTAISATLNAYKTAQLSPITLVNPAYPAIQAGLAAAFGAVSIAKIASSKYKSSGAGAATSFGAPSAGGGGANTPQFNTIGTANNNQLAESIAGQNKNPARAYVVASDVSTAQALDRNKIDTASFG